MDIISEIKSRLSIADVLHLLGIQPMRGYIKSIYREERTPSTKIYLNTNTYYDYSTSQGGDQIKLYADYYRIENKRAISELAKLLHLGEVTTHNREQTPEQIRHTENITDCMSQEELELFSERAGMTESDLLALIEVKRLRLENNKLIIKELERYLRNQGFNKHALDYLINKRKFSREFIEKEFLFVFDYYAVNGHLKKQFSPDELKRAGLISEKGNFIFFAHRILIPYRHYGDIIYLRGRYFDQDNNSYTEKNKFLGQKDDLLHVNSARRMYNTDVFLTILPFERLYITEGEFDAAILKQQGFNAVAIPGVGNMPKEPALKKLLMYEIVLCLDNDSAGGTLRQNLIDFFHNNGKNVFEKVLPEGVKDINDFVKMVS